MYILNDYDHILKRILEVGQQKVNKRTGEITKSIHGVQCEYNVSEVFPILSRRKINWKSNIAELLWFIEGSTNKKRLKELGCNYWEPWGGEAFERRNKYEEGQLGPVYGFQLRHFGAHYKNLQESTYSHHIIDGDVFYFKQEPYKGIDQLQNLLDGIARDPSDRGLVVNLWNVEDLDKMALRPCAYAFQVLISDSGIMDGVLMQRSADWPVGVPYNIIFYTTFLSLIALHTGYKVGTLIHQVGDAHIYENQIPSVEEYLATPKNPTTAKLLIEKQPNIFSYKLDNFKVDGYKYPKDIKFPVAV